jgi:DNA repair protein SbcC/Rad50
LGQFPKAQVSDINSAFNKAIDAFEQKLKDERVTLKQQVWINLFTANELVNNHELALVKGNESSAETLQAQVEEITQWPSGGLKAIQQKVARANASADLDANLNALRELCIRADILTGTETPATEQTLRTAFQVNQLQQNFGRKAQDISTDFENLVFEWIGVGAVETNAYNALFSRFNASRLKAAK